MSALVNSPSLIAASPKRRPCSFCSCMTWATVSGVRRPARIRMAPSERSPGALAGTRLSTSSESRGEHGHIGLVSLALEADLGKSLGDGVIRGLGGVHIGRSTFLC